MTLFRHALVTGAAGAIGAAIATSLRARERGARITLVDIDESAAREVAARLGGDVTVERWDLAEPGSLPARVEALVDAHGAVDALVNCAGIMEVRSFASTPWDVASRLMRIDLESPLLLMSALVPEMVRTGRGLVVNVASMAGMTPLRGCAYYGAAKAGLSMASEIARLELEPHGVHVVTVLPGPVRSGLERRARAQFGTSSIARLVPAGDPTVLGERVVDACERRRPRVVYPPVYELASRFPAIATTITRALSPSAAG